MNRTCIVVADAGLARFFDVEADESPRVKVKLVERAVLTNDTDLKSRGESASGKARTETNSNREAGPVHPIEAQREQHRVELDRRFSRAIVRKSAELTREWKGGVVVLAADPRLLGMMRGALREALPRGVELKELAKDFTRLAPSELFDRLVASGLVPPRHPTQ